VDSQGKFAQSNNPGAYFKLAFTGTTSVSLQLDLSDTPTNPFMKLRYTLNDLPYVDVTLPITQLVIASGLKATDQHTLIVYILASSQGEDRWNGPRCVCRVLGLGVDTGASLLPPVLRPKKMIVYLDSIGEDVRVLGASAAPGTVTKTEPIDSKSNTWLRDDLHDNDSTAVWTMSLAAALDAEISVVAFGRQGYVVWGNGNVVPVCTPGNATLSAWNRLDSKNLRSWTTPPDYIFSGHGTNDRGQPDANITASALCWLNGVRSIAPLASVHLVVPYGGFLKSQLQLAFTQFQAQKADPHAYFIDLGARASLGVTGLGPSAEAVDGLHPRAIRSTQLGAILAAAAIRAEHAHSTGRPIAY